MSSGLENLSGVQHSNTNLVIVIIVMSTVATIAAVSGVENGIRPLLRQLDLQPSQSIVQRFMDKHVSPALQDATAQMRAQGLEVQTLLGKSKRCMGVRVEMEEGNPFVHEVSLTATWPRQPNRLSRMKRASVTTAPRCTCTTAARTTT